jgi:hypothetical protein
MTINWPTAELDGVRRLHVMAAGISGATVTERVITAAFDTVWPLLADLEGGFGEILPDMRHVRVARRNGDQVEALARSRYGMRAHLRGEVSTGWCWLQSRFLLIGVAARPENAHTRVAITGGLRVPGRAAIIPVGARREASLALDRLQQLT